MRVLFVSPAAELGGAERCLLDGVAALHAQGRAQVSVLALADGPLLAKARELGAETQVVQAPRGLSALGESASGLESKGALLSLFSTTPDVLRFLRQLRRAIVRARPDVVHTNGMKAHLLAGALTPAHARLVVHLHDFIGARRASARLLPALRRLRGNTVFVANSQAVAQDFSGIAPSADVRTVYNVVDTDYFCEGTGEPAWLAKLAGLPPPNPGTLVFGLVATYARWKGHGLFIEAAGLLSRLHPEIPLRFYVVGGPIYETLGSQVAATDLLRQARAAGIEAHFGLVPFQGDIARVYRSLDVVVHASTQPEPFGRTIVEAMACGRPVIVTRSGGAAELFEDDVNAFGVEPGNAAKLSEAMVRALDPAARMRLGRTAREHAVTSFSRSRLAQQLLQVYTEPRPRNTAPERSSFPSAQNRVTPKRIAWVTPEYPPQRGGVSDHSHEMVKVLRAAGHDVLVCSRPHEAGFARLDAELAAYGPDLLVVAYTPLAYAPHTGGIAPAFTRWTVGLRRRYRCQTVLLAHETSLPLTFHWQKREFKLATLASIQMAQFAGLAASFDVVLYSNAGTRDAWARHLPRLANRLHTLRICSNIPYHASNDATAELIAAGSTVPRPTVLFFGTGHDSVLFDFVEEAFRAVLHKEPNAGLVIVGMTPEKLRRLRPSLAALGERVQALGYVPAELVSLWLQVATIVLTPLIEGVSARKGTVAAALQHGQTVVTTRGAQTLADVAWSEICVLAPVDRQAFAAAAVRAIEDRELRATIGHAARSEYAEHASATVTASLILDYADRLGARTELFSQ